MATLLSSLISSFDVVAQQLPDLAFDVRVAQPSFPAERGPLLAIDEAHRNFHTASGRYKPFANLARNDGFRVVENTRAFTVKELERFKLLVISNAIGADDENAYTHSAFSTEESAAVRDWVSAGGALLLIADHAPMGVAAESLAQKFGVEMGKGFTEDSEHSAPAANPSILEFSRQNGLLADHVITRGRSAAERINRVVAFTGQSLRGPTGSVAILQLGAHAIDHPSPTPAQAAAQPNPAIAWHTAVAGMPTHPASGRAMGLVFSLGRGRVVVLGEAAMLTAQRTGEGAQAAPMGMNVPGNDNKQFALNLLRWLAGVLR